MTYPLREKGYNMNDVLGISGLESVYEDELRGKDGVETITRNSDGVIVDTKITTVPEPGHTVQLTINSDFQRAVNKALADNIDMINRTYNTGNMKAAAGAAVVMDVKDGSVLAAANYPSFDQNLYAANYSASTAPTRACRCSTAHCRACIRRAPPSSPPWRWLRWTPASSTGIPRYTATACTTTSRITTPSCTRHGHSGNIDVITAIKWSCNIFFYDVGPPPDQ